MSFRHRQHTSWFSCRLGPLLYFAALLLIALSLIAVERTRTEPRDIQFSAPQRLAV